VNALQIIASGGPNIENNLNSLKNKIKKISLGGITTGNFIRGIKNN